MRSLEVCAGAGGSALGLEQAGFDPVMLIDFREVACQTLLFNRPGWDVLNMDLREFDPADHKQVYDVDLLSAGLPRVEAKATANRPTGSGVELELLKATVMLMHGVRPRSLLIENVPDLVTNRAYARERSIVERELEHLGYRWRWDVIDAKDFGVPQYRKQGLLIAFRGDLIDGFRLPSAPGTAPSVGTVLGKSMAARGWAQAQEWAAHAHDLAPTVVGGSWNRGGADLGPTGTKNAWERMGVNGGSVADDVPDSSYRWSPDLERHQMVKLTLEQVAILQGFPPDWRITGLKTARYRQLGEASPPPVAKALGESIRAALSRE